MVGGEIYITKYWTSKIQKKILPTVFYVLVSINKGQSYSFPGHPPWLSGKESTCIAGDRDTGLISGDIPQRRAWQPTPVFLPGESYGQRGLVGYSPRGHRVRHD